MTTTAPAELAPVSAARKALKKARRSIADVVRAVHSASSQAPQATEIEVAPQAPLPVKPVVTDDVRAALAIVVDKVRSVRVPTGRAKLSAAQEQSMGEALAQTKVIAGWLDDLVQDTFRPAFFNHFDVKAETSGLVGDDTARDKDGFYLLNDSIKLESGAEVKRERRVGTVKLTADNLLDLVEQGLIDRALYLKLTKPVRVVDEDATLSALEKDPSLALVLHKAATVGTGSVALQVR
jgi:hypothetical protein